MSQLNDNGLREPKVLETIEGDKDRKIRSWKAAAWAPVIVGLIDLIYEGIKYLVK